MYKARRTPRFTFDTIDSLPDIEQPIPQLDLTVFQPIQTG
jgi:hypothetical protein